MPLLVNPARVRRPFYYDPPTIDITDKWGDPGTIDYTGVIYGNYDAVTYAIGYIGTGSVFVPLIPNDQIVNGAFTMPEAADGKEIWLAATIVSRFPVIELVNSGVTIDGETGDNPVPTFSIAADQWTVEHADDVAIGKRRVLVNGSVTVPSGHVIKFYSGTIDGGQAVASSQTLTPNVEFVTNGVLAVGAMCRNSLWLYRAADGAIIPASVDQKSFLIEQSGGGVDPDPPVDPGEFPDYDYEAATKAAALSELAAWNSNWNGTVPAGKTAADPRYLGLPDGNHGALSVTYDFPQRVYIGSTNRATLGARLTSLTVTGATNVWGHFLDISQRGAGSGGNAVLGPSSLNCGIEYCNVEGDYNHIGSAQFGSYGVNIYPSSVNFTVQHCVIGGSWSKGIMMSGTTGAVIEGNLFVKTGADCIHGNAVTGAIVRRNWFSRNKSIAGHNDWFQLASANTNHDCQIYGNVGMYSGMSAASGLGFNSSIAQGIFLANCSALTIEQNIICTNHHWGIIAATGPQPSLVRSNTVIFIPEMIYPNGVVVPGTTNSDRIQSICQGDNPAAGCGDNISTPSNSGPACPGTGNINIRIGSVTAGVNYDEVLTYYENLPTRFGKFIDIAPVVGSAAHWGAATPKGAALRFKEILVDGIHPGNQPGPVAAAWRTWYDPSSEITS